MLKIPAVSHGLLIKIESKLWEQLSLFAQQNLNQITNVSSVPQRSPFRYPGGIG